MNRESKWIAKLQCEFVPTSNQTRLGISDNTYKGRTSVLLNWSAGLSAYVNWIFGTLVFSSTMFVGTLSALSVISRYAASACLCRGILLFELAGLGGADGADDLKATSASTGDHSLLEAKLPLMSQKSD